MMTTTVEAHPRWARVGLIALLVATFVFWTVGLGRNGWANAFYSAAVQAGTKSWKAFLFGSSDAGNSITVDKPPASLWVMEISTRIFEVNTWAILIPQVLLGVASVALLYVTLKRHFGPAAGLIAGGVLAVTPVATLMFRFNNPDALLVFLMVASVWAVLRAVDDGRTRWLVLCGALLGLGFLTKQLQVLLVVPGLALTYLIAGPPRLRTRLLQLLAGLMALVVAAGWWVAIVELTPAGSRPYVGGSAKNSFLELTLGYNGLGRIAGGAENFPGGHPPAGPAGGHMPPMPFGHAGVGRLFSGESGAQISWLLPAAVVLLVVGVLLWWRAPRTDGHRAQYLVWGGWLVGTGAVFSFMSGLFHDYYTVALAPAVAALVGIGAVDLWGRRESRWALWTLALVVAGTGVWSWVLLTRTPDFVSWLRWTVLAVAIGAAAALLVPRVKHWAAVAAVTAALAGPLAYSIQTVITAQTGPVVTAGPRIAGQGFGKPPGMGENTLSDRVVQTLTSGAPGFTWIAATAGAISAAGPQLATGYPVMPLGGFAAADPSPTLEQFQTYVSDKRIHYYLDAPTMGPPPGMSPPGGLESERIKDWVRANYRSTVVDGVTLYDLTVPLR